MCVLSEQNVGQVLKVANGGGDPRSTVKKCSEGEKERGRAKIIQVCFLEVTVIDIIAGTGYL